MIDARAIVFALRWKIWAIYVKLSTLAASGSEKPHRDPGSCGCGDGRLSRV
jgi:hypothetical protein